MRSNAEVVLNERHMSEQDLTDPARILPYMPDELVNEIASHLESAVDIFNLRLVNKRFYNAAQPAYFHVIGNMQIIHPRYASFRGFFFLLGVSSVLPNYVRKITLVTEGLRVHKYGYEWAWEQLADTEDIRFTTEDMDIINTVNCSHSDDITANGAFLTGGGYRSMLLMLLRRLPKLECIELRPLGPTEHNPGWVGPELLKGLSFYNDKLNIKEIFYGGWQYDTDHLCVTVYEDEFGDEVTEEGAGPQATFEDDLAAAVAGSGRAAQIHLVWK